MQSEFRKNQQKEYSQRYRTMQKRARESINDEDVKLEKSFLLQSACVSVAGKINKISFSIFILLI